MGARTAAAFDGRLVHDVAPGRNNINTILQKSGASFATERGQVWNRITCYGYQDQVDETCRLLVKHHREMDSARLEDRNKSRMNRAVFEKLEKWQERWQQDI